MSLRKPRGKNKLRVKWLSLCEVHHTCLGVFESSEYELIYEGRSVGIVEMSKDDLYLYIFNIFIEEEYRGKGIATTFLTKYDKLVAAFSPVQEAEAFWQKHADEIYY